MRVIHPGICKNCRVAIYGVPNGKGGWIYKHNVSFRFAPCDNPERRPEDTRPCTCVWPHYNCNGYDQVNGGPCNCVRHIGQIHWE